MDASSLIKSLSKYLYNNIDNSYSYKIDSRYAEVMFTVLYTVPDEIIEIYDLPIEYGEVCQMDVMISFSPYSDSFRMEIVSLDEGNRTISFSKFKVDSFKDPQNDFKKIYDKVFKILEREFEGYEFIY